MSFNVTIDVKPIKKLSLAFIDLNRKATPKAHRLALNKMIVSVRLESIRRTKIHFKLKTKPIKDRMRITRARGGNIKTLVATLSIQDRPLNLLLFKTGNKEPKSQKGLRIKNRPRVKVQVRPGKKVLLKKAFVQTGRGNKNFIFRRRSSKSRPIVKQTAPSLHILFSRPVFRAPIEEFAKRRYLIEFERAYKVALDTVGQKIK